jgi:hypothetical protein
MRGRLIVGVTVGLLLALPAASHASKTEGAKYTLSFTKQYLPSPWTEHDRYLPRAKGKLIFGAKNALLGCLELYNEPRDARRQNTGFMRGMGRGLVNMLGDTIGGVLHVATFPITAVDVSLPEGGTDLL